MKLYRVDSFIRCEVGKPNLSGWVQGEVWRAQKREAFAVAETLQKTAQGLGDGPQRITVCRVELPEMSKTELVLACLNGLAEASAERIWEWQNDRAS